MTSSPLYITTTTAVCITSIIFSLMRVKLRYTVVGVVVIATTLLLWLQCQTSSVLHHSSGTLITTGIQAQHSPQHGRLPLQTEQRLQRQRQYNGVGIVGVVDEADEYDSGPFVGDPFTAERQDGAPIQQVPPQQYLSDIPCVINQETTVTCKRDSAEVYVPFSFLQRYFEVFGFLQRPNEKSRPSQGGVPSNDAGEYDPPPTAGGGEGGEVFIWQHSSSKVFEPSLPYSPHGTFLNFQLYSVESRDRVKCVSAIDGVPISTQWQSSGHTYPIQIAQFGLAHYCKLLTESKPKRTVLEDASDRMAAWVVGGGNSRIGRVGDPYRSSRVFRYRARECSVGGKPSGGVQLVLPSSVASDQLTLSVDWFLQHNTSLTISYTLKDKKMQTFYVHYLPGDTLIWTKAPRDIYYGLGLATGWRRFTRNLLVDLQKGVAAMPHVPRSLKKISRSRVQIKSIHLCGEGRLDNLTFSTAEHLQHFYAAADWLTRHQDQKGGWAITVPRTVVKGVLQLPKGWYSAMAQGQAISLLVRAAHHSGDSGYIDAAIRALQLYAVNSTQGGVRAFFPGGFAWYEEYPTTPSLFVLNGFIYSLIGLYDLKEARPGPSTVEASKLYDEGMRSLKTLLPLFDTGWGSLYDLRHFTSHIAPRPARWDYHTTHITQLLLLSALDSDPVLRTTAERWRQYLKGKRASHN